MMSYSLFSNKLSDKCDSENGNEEMIFKIKKKAN